MFEVVYYSMTGSTKKVAEAIANELGVSADDVKTKGKLAKDSIVFLGSGYYFSGTSVTGRSFKKFVEGNDFNERRVALFGTSGAGVGNEVNALEKMVTAKGAIVAGRFWCRGRFLFFLNQKNPTNEDLDNAKKFAGEMKNI